MIQHPIQETPIDQLKRHTAKWVDYFDKRITSVAKGVMILLCAFFIVLMILTVAVSNHRQEINDLTRRLEALENRKQGSMLKFLFCLIVGHTKHKECERCGKMKREYCAQCGLGAKADPRCEGGNCTKCCKWYCTIDCVKEWLRGRREREEFTDRMLKQERRMVEILRFTMESFGHFCGVLFLIFWIFLGLWILTAIFGFALSQYKPTIKD